MFNILLICLIILVIIFSAKYKRELAIEVEIGKMLEELKFKIEHNNLTDEEITNKIIAIEEYRRSK